MASGTLIVGFPYLNLTTQTPVMLFFLVKARFSWKDDPPPSESGIAFPRYLLLRMLKAGISRSDNADNKLDLEKQPSRSFILRLTSPFGAVYPCIKECQPMT
jgi:hypothetical protein